MSVEVRKDGIMVPQQNNLTWVFRVQVNGADREWRIDSFDLNMWFREAVGRHPRHERGDTDTKEDILQNWDRVEPRLRKEAEREANLPMNISVDGGRTSAEDWQVSQQLPEADLPPLNDLQREAARKLKISEVEYARSYFAGQQSMIALLGKTERVGRFLQNRLRELEPQAAITEITLRTLEARFDLKVVVAGTSIPLRIEESLMDDLFEGGSAEAEQRVRRVLQIALETRTVP
ncbi:MAG: hypothetical protein ACRD3A_09975 [Terriglobales bacterium]